MSPDLFLLILAGLIAAMVMTLGQLRASLEVPSCPECPHCRQLEREAAIREQGEQIRLEERIREYERVDEPERKARDDRPRS